MRHAHNEELYDYDELVFKNWTVNRLIFIVSGNNLSPSPPPSHCRVSTDRECVT